MASVGDVIIKNPNIMHGTPVFRCTRVPFQALLDYLKAGDTLDEFLEDFPSVSRKDAITALEDAKAALVGQLGWRSFLTNAFPSVCEITCPVINANPLDTLVSRDSRTDLLAAAEAAKFDVLLTVDHGLEYEQNLTRRQIAILILSTKSIRLDLLPHVPNALVALQSLQSGQVVRVGLES
jgi:uncharacterized protein (DUF433 family)